MSDSLRGAGVVSGGCKAAAAGSRRSAGPLRRNGDPRPVSLHGRRRYAGASGVWTMAGALYGWPDGASIPASGLRRLRPAAGAGGGLPHRRPHGGGAVYLRRSDPAGGGTAPDLLQQLQPGVPRQRAGQRRVRQRSDGAVAVADPRLLRPADGAAVPGAGAGTAGDPAARFLSVPLPVRSHCLRREGRRRRDAVRLRLRDPFLCAGIPALPVRHSHGRAGRGDYGAVFPDAPADL